MSELTATLRQLSEAFQHLGHAGAFLREEYVLRQGVVCTAQALPKGFRRGTPKLCFHNARKLVLNRRRRGSLTYVEGYAMRADIGIPMHHAWAIDAERRVIDVTWADPQNTEYLGVPFSAATLRQFDDGESMLGVDFIRVDFMLATCPALRPLVEASKLTLQRRKQRLSEETAS